MTELEPTFRATIQPRDTPEEKTPEENKILPAPTTPPPAPPRPLTTPTAELEETLCMREPDVLLQALPTVLIAIGTAYLIGTITGYYMFSSNYQLE